MAIVPGKPTRACLDIFDFILCMLLTALQLGLLDYYFLRYRSDDQWWWWAWIGADALVLIIMLAILIMALRYNQQAMDEYSSAGNFDYNHQR